MKRIRRYPLRAILPGVFVFSLAVRGRYVLDSQKLHTAIKAQLPAGTPKTPGDSFHSNAEATLLRRGWNARDGPVVGYRSESHLPQGL